VKFMIKCFEANYPESLGAVLVHKAPWIFQGIWSIIRGWLDPVVASKVHFTKNVDELSSFIPNSHIPTELGGSEDWSYSYTPPADNENEIMKDTETRDKLLAQRQELVDQYEEKVVAWFDDEKAENEERRKERGELAEKLRRNYWEMDPYVRARSLYDRLGVMRDGGKVDFYGKATDTALEQPTDKTNGKASETSADDVD
jgi:hypothetical protein